MNNIFHRYINLPFEITKPPICNLRLKQLKQQSIPYHEDKKMLSFLNKLGVDVLNIEVFYTPSKKSLPIHLDTDEIDNHVKLNISYGPPEGATRWWKPLNFNLEKEKEKIARYSGEELMGLANSHHNYKPIMLKEEECELVYDANTNTPSLVNAGIFHSSYNPTDEGRWTLSFVIGKNNKYLCWDDAIEIFKDYIE